MGLPPVEVGVVQLTVACAFPATAVGLITAEGKVAGVTGDVVASGPSPLALVATIEKVYGVPLLRPLTLQVSSPVVVQVKEPGDEVTV